MPERSVGAEVVIVGQYSRVVAALDSMFTVMRPRIAWEVWRVNGVGSCHIDRETSEYGLNGPARDLIIDLRDIRNEAVEGERLDESVACPYHRVWRGCVLGNLKSPICISHIDAPWELSDRFGINGYALRGDIDEILETVLNGKADEEFVVLACDAVEQMTQYIKRFPVLPDEEIGRVTFLLGGGPRVSPVEVFEDEAKG